MDLNNRHSCHRALQTRDRRFDGRLFIGVTSTGIYCRPICPARTARIDNCVFYPSAAAAQQAGFRPCLRCRPESAPGGGIWRGSADTVARALDWMNGGFEDDSRLGAIAARLGVSDRQLRRLFNQHLGASPVAVLQTRRILLAKQLIHETSLPMTQVALAAGFGSVRRFNETFRAMYRRPPSELRRDARRDRPDDVQAITLSLRYHPPYDWPAMLDSLRAHAIAGVESVDADNYRRGVRIGALAGSIRVAHDARAGCLLLTVHFPDVRFLPDIVARATRLFDIGADIAAIGEHLAREPLLAALVARRPGLRVPGVWDPFEVALASAIGLGASPAGRAVRFATLLDLFAGDAPGDGPRCLPSPAQLACADLSTLGTTGAMLGALAQSALDDPDLLTPYAEPGALAAHLGTHAAIGAAAATVLAHAALRDSDAVAPEAMATLGAGLDALRPWRAYAQRHLDLHSHQHQ
jgi:AraC family transcriptional regulator of adaptative response / DNA-3-methyladenine glycosylase II